MKKTFFIALASCTLLFCGEAVHAQKTSRTKSKTSATVKRKRSAFGTAGQYPESTDRLLTQKDVENATPWGLKVMQNEIYARHGYVFTDAELKKHFRKEDWYKGKERTLKKIKLTSTETQNITFLKAQQPKL
ncbi:MAG: YARHG domain-containing protein [Sphingobacteriales bacterium]|nr:MAG: YARHG domain-containing protein [Sphingobacteriales bacterium]